MTDNSEGRSAPTALLCFDGSDGAAAAIAKAADLLGPVPAVLLYVSEPVREWEPWDPATILTIPLERVVAEQTHVDEIVARVAEETADRGLELARQAGFEVTKRVAAGKVAQTICEVADELGVEPIVVGTRGLGPGRAFLLGSVSASVIANTQRPVIVVPSD